MQTIATTASYSPATTFPQEYKQSELMLMGRATASV